MNIKVKQFQDEYQKGWMVGSAQRENELYLDSIAGKMNTLKENLKGLLTGNFSTGIFKDMLDGANNVVLAIDKITSSLGKIGTGGVLFGLMNFIRTMGNLDTFAVTVQKLGGYSMFGGLGQTFKNIKAGFDAGGIKGGLNSVQTAMVGLGNSTTVTTMAWGALKAVMAGIAFAGIVYGISQCVKAWDNYVNATENAVEASKQKQDNIRDELQTLNTQKSGLQEIATEYDKLASKSKLTYDEASKLKSLKQEIAEIAPELVAGYDANNDPILKLDGSLSQYIGNLDKAIAKQQELFNYETKQQARAYMKENDKGGSVDDDKYRTEQDTALQNIQTRLADTRRKEEEYTARSVDWAKKRIKARQEEADMNAQELSEISRVRAEASAKDEAIQSNYINNFLKNSEDMRDEYKNQFSGFMSGLDWSQLGENQANQLGQGLQTLSEKTAFTFQQLGTEARKATIEANKAFEDTGAINTYGKALQQIAKDSGQFDLTSWSNYLDEVNARFEAGAMTNEQYTYSLGIMADTMSSMTGIPADVFETALKGTGNLEEAFQNATTGLNNFLEAYGSSTYKLQQGDSFAESLKEQFNDLLDFGNNFDLELQTEGKVTCDWLIDQKNLHELPKQMNDMIDLVTGDNKVTEVEEKVIMAVQTEIKNEGQLKDETVKTIEGLLDGSLNIDSDIEIGGLKLGRHDAEQLRESLRNAGIEAKDLKLGDTGMDEAQAQAKELEQTLKGVEDVEIRAEIEQIGFDSADKVENLMSQLEKIPDKKKTEFIADTGEYFNKYNTVEEAIKNMPPEIKLKYNIGVEGDSELERIQSLYKDLPESIQTKIGIENGDYTAEQIEMISEMVDTFGEKDTKAFLEIDGASEAIDDCTNVKDFLEKIQQLVVEGKIEITADTEEGEEANDLLDETDGKEANATVNASINEQQYDKLKEAIKTIDKQDGKKTKSEHKVEADTKELDKAEEKQKKQDGKKTKSKHEAKADTKEIDEAEKKIEKLTTGTHGEVTLTVTGKEQVEATINKKKELEVDGKAVTYVQVDGGQQYAIAINEKGQLEVNGVAQTDIKVNGGEKLTLTKNDKGELEVNGQAVTTVKVNGKEELDETKEKKSIIEQPSEGTVSLKTEGADQLKQVIEDKKEAGKDEEAKVSVTMTLKNTIDNLLAKAGLTKSTANIEINITCQDSATPILSKIEGYNNKSILVNITGQDTVTSKLDTIKGMSNISINVNISAPNLSTVKSQLDSIANKQIGTKSFTISCPNGTTILSQINQLSNKTINDKQFYVNANGDKALSVVNNLASKVINDKHFSVTLSDQATSALNTIIAKNVPAKTFTISCTDNASSKVDAVQRKKIDGKSFTITCNDNASGTLRSIKSSLADIKSKTVTVTVKRSTIGSMIGGLFTGTGSPEVVTMDSNIVRNATVDNSNVVSALESSNNDVVSAMASKKTSINSSYTLNAVKYNIDMLTRMSNILGKLSTQLDTISAKADRAFGTSKAKLLKQEITLMQKQQSLLNTNYNNMSAMSKKLKSSLKSQGFKFNDDGSISNYTSKLITLNKAVEKAQKSQDNYTGKSEKKQKSLQKAVDKANDKLTKAQNELNEYYDLTFSQMPNAKKEWEELANSIAEAKAEIISANHEAKVLYETLQMEVNDFYGGKKATDQSKNEALAEYVDDTNEKIKYLEKANKDIEEQISRQQNTIKQANSRIKDDRAILEDYGFKFTKYGNIDGGASTLNSLAKKLSPAEYEAVYAIWQEYMQDITETVPDAEMEIINLNQAIKDNEQAMEDLRKAEEEEIRTKKELIRETKIDVLTNQYDRLSTSLDLLSAKQDNAFGKNKLKYMKEQIDLTQSLIFQQEKLGMQYKANANELKNELATKYSIRFDSSGNMVNLSEMISTMGSSEDMEELKQLADEYNDAIQNWAESEVEVENLNGQMQDLKDSMIELNDEMEEIRRNAMATELDNSFKVLENQLDMINAKMELAGANQSALLKEQISLYKQLTKETYNSLSYYEDLSKELTNDLGEYGFTINDDGTIDNTAKRLELLKNSLSETEFDHVNQLLEDYFNVALDKIPELEQNLIDYQKAEEDIYRDKLETAKDIEEEITKIYEKQIEERIDAIEKEKDARVDALNKAKEAYQKYRDDVEYNNDYEEQLKAVQDLEKQIEIAKRDTSLSGQKRLADLMEQLNDEQKNLEKLVSDKIDEDINNMFDDEIDRTEKEAEDKINNINEVWSESKVAEAVKEALQTGIFTDIDGNIKALDDALLDFANNSSDYLGVMGATLKTELLDNLGVALDTMAEIDKIYKELAVPSELANYTLPDNLSNELANNKGYYNQTVSQNTITIGNTNITITGSASDATVEELDERLTEFREQLVNEIMKNVY